MTTNQNRRRMPTTTTNWCDLPLELLELISKKLAFIDIVRFKSVCSCWKSAAESYTSSPNYTPAPEAPWLMVSLPADHQRVQTGDKDAHYFWFFSLTEKKFRKIKTSFEGFDYPHVTYAGSSHGWLAICDFNKAMVYLLNPFSGSRIDLPSISTLPNIVEGCNPRVCRVVASSDPSRNKKFFVVVKYVSRILSPHSKLAFCKNGDEKWTYLGGGRLCFTFHKGHLYVLRKETLEVWDLGGTYPMKTVDFRHGLGRVVTGVNFLESTVVNMVDSLGELYLFGKNIRCGKTISKEDFHIYKLNFTSKEWEKVECLNDQAIFCNHSDGVMLLSTRNLPEFEENSIYFTEWRKDEVSGLLFSLESQVTKEYSNFRWMGVAQPYVWIVPNPW
ncbi:putative F-box protein At4g22660 [Rosa rugosa]|uniref:putative F-box protein At4g22660 n=1 Tax=Rosa rugosa TaxID=74645 RepID=UPI002B406C54|nr:putative F-box protein At4g22660 [Rosa rugosa]